jgi:iron complex outermembrane recepter protein
MTRKKNRARAIQRALMASAVAIAAYAVGAQAQQAPQETAQAAPAPVDVTTVTVTGTRIVTPNATSASPVQALNVQSIQATGQNDVSNIINQLPQVFNNDLGQDLGNRTSGLTTAGGVATADLRGLGPNRTLVLVDGRRLGQGSPYTFIQSPAPDLDQIPMFMVERIDVLTGGASSVYGSDAIAGVVNFVLKKNFQGIQLDAQIGENWHNQHSTYAESLNRDFGLQPLTGTAWDGRNRNFSVIMGTNFADGQGNITGWLQYYHQDPVTSGDRDFGQCQLAANSSANAPLIGGVPAIDSAICVGSSNSNFFRQVGTSDAFSVTGTYPNNTLIPWGSANTTPPAAFNSQPYIYMQRQDNRYLGGFTGHYDIADWIKPYAQFSFMDDRTHQEVAPAALFRASNPLDPISNNYYTNCGNPLLSLQEATTLGCTAAQIGALNQNDPANWVNVEIGRRNVEGGGRISEYEHTNYRAVLGASGEFLRNWVYDVYAQYYYTSFFNTNEKYLNFQAIDNALLVTGTHASPSCISGAPCVPYDIWEDGGVTNAALQYLYATGTGQGSTTLRTYHADVTGSLGDYGVKSPIANDGVDVNIGWEHRNENVTFNPDQFELSGLLSGFGSAAVAINNSQSVDEEFIEVRAPIVQDAPFAKEVLIDPGFRHSKYSVAGSVNTYKVDLQWAPVADYRLRGSWQRAIRAPSIIELFNPDLVGLIQLGADPCAPPEGGGTPTASLQQCLHTVSPAQAAAFTAAYNGGTIPQGTAGQLSQETGGSTSLKPEIGTSFSAGVLFNPAAIPNLTGSVDWWQIRVDGEVGVLPANFILSNCLQTGDPATCSQIVRNPNTFGLTGATIAAGGYIIQTNRNIASAEVQGIDLQANYRMDLPARLGGVRFTLNGSYLLKSLSTPFQGAHTYDCAGLFGSTCQTVNPRWRHNMTIAWDMPWNVEVGMNWRFIGKVGYEGDDPDVTLAAAGQAIFGAYDLFNKQIGNYSYFDLFGSWNVWKGIQIRAGIDNVLDKDPPIVTSEIVAGGAANTYSTYDQLGRQIYLAVTAKF